MPLQVIIPKSLEEKDGWPALRNAILESFSAPAQETGASSLEMENPTHLELFNLATPSKPCPPPLSQSAPGCVTRHTRHASVTHFRPISGNIVEVTLMTPPIMYINSHAKETYFP